MPDVRDALRALRATPVISAVAVLSLALGIGANTAIFSIVNTLSLRSLPVRDPQRLVLLEGRRSWTNPIWEQIRDRQDRLFDSAFAWTDTRFNLSASGGTRFVNGIWASGRFFDVLGVRALLGRTFTPADDVRGGGAHGPVAVISYAFWQRHFGATADVVGRSLVLDLTTFTIIGVTPPGFFGPSVGRAFDVAIPLGTEPLLRPGGSALDQRSFWWLKIMARLKPGQTAAQATAALRGVQPQIREATLPPNWRPEALKRYLADAFTLAPAATGWSRLREEYARPLRAVMVVVALVLLIACANIANLLLARATARRHELSVRLALGASRWRLARQLLSESLLLSGIGAGLGLGFAAWGSALLVRQLSTGGNDVFLDLSLDWRVLGFTAAVAVGTAILFGTVPALRAARVEPNEAIKEQGRGVAGERRTGFGGALVVGQVALSLVLVVAAGLFVRTFSALSHLDLGFDRDNVLVVDVGSSQIDLKPAGQAALFDRLLRSVAAVPGVAHASLSVITPASGAMWNGVVDVPGAPAMTEEERTVCLNFVTPDWFATYGTPILAGRAFDDHDRDGSRPVAIVNEAFARRFLDGASPIGRTVRRRGQPGRAMPSREIVGLARDAVYTFPRDPIPPTMYLPLAQPGEDGRTPWVALSVRSAGGSPARLAGSVVAAMAGVDRHLALTVRLLADQVSESLLQERLVAMISGFFGALALLLAGIGLYGVTAYAVSRRRAEIGIRLALGAQPGGVIRLVLRRVALLVGAGVVVGGVASLWAARFAGSLLYGLQPRDPVTLAAAAAVLAGVGALAGWLPARRASRIDPARALREG
jgi:predicted permease